MEKLIPKIREIAARINEAENKRKRLAEFLENVNERTNLSRHLVPERLDDIRIAGVDGGLLKRSLHGFDCAIARAVAVCFHYKGGRIENVEYWPSKIPTPVPEIMEALSDLDWAYSCSILRLKTEISTAIECIGKLNPHILLLDGLVVPHYSDKPSKGSPIYREYMGLIDLYKRLYEKAKATNTVLAGVVEDSRSSVFCNLIKEDILSKVKHESVPEIRSLLERTRDTNLLFLLLKKGERTRIFSYSKSPLEHPVLKDMSPWSENIQSFYLKTARLDRPIKVDFIGTEKNDEHADKLASILLSISGQHSGYGLPAPIIEADNAAKLSENDMDVFYSRMLSFTGNLPSIMRLRRDQRPF